MSFICTINAAGCDFQGSDFDVLIDGSVTVYSKNFNSEEAAVMVQQYRKQELAKWFDQQCDKETFMVVLHDAQKNILEIYNDKVSSNDILYNAADSFVVSDNIKKLFEQSGVAMEVDRDSAHEFITFFDIVPPRTMYKNIYAVPFGSVLRYHQDSGVVDLESYWHPENLLMQKEGDYDSLIKKSRQALEMSMQEVGFDGLGVSLSSGVDSGGLLSMLTKIKGAPVESVTMGPYGSEYKDVKFAQKTAEYNQSPNTLIYPKIEDLKKLPDFSEGLSKPVEATAIVAYGLLMETAAQSGISKLIFGHGAEMLVGNLKIMRLAYTLSKIERVIPRFILNPMYRLGSFIKGFSENQREFLLETSWVDRFLRTRGTLFIKEKKYYRNFNPGFIDGFKKKLKGIFAMKENSLLDQLVMCYLSGWVYYMQMRDFTMLGKRFNIKPVVPFDNPKVMREVFRTNNEFRKLNKWNKQVIRDIFRPYVNEDMYTGEVGSLIVPYNVWFQDNYPEFIAYLKTSPIVSDIIDLDLYENEFNLLPEPGLSLVRLLNLAVWYDVNWNPDNIQHYKRLFTES